MKNKISGGKRNVLLIVGICLAVNLYGGLKKTEKDVSKPITSTARMLNPIATQGLYIADPEARQMPDGRVYLYGSRDVPGTAWCSHSYHVLSTSDMVHWDVEQFSFATQGVGKQTDYTDRVLYAPDGELIGTCELEPMEGEVAYAIHKTSVKPVTSRHAVVLVFKGKDAKDNQQHLMNLEWFVFEAAH